MRKVVALITGPYQLLQVLWYYSVHPDCKYIAIVKTAGLDVNVKQSLIQYCKNSQIFEEVIETKTTDIESSVSKKLSLGMKMIGYYVAGKREVFTGKIITQEIGNINYDTAIVDSEFSILGGAFIDHSDEKEIVIMQEGLFDIEQRRKLPKYSIKDFFGYALAKMGYCNIMQSYTIKKTRNCEKLMSHPQLAVYKNFNRITKIFAEVNEDSFLFNALTQKTFHFMDWQKLQNTDVILFTNTLEIFTNNLGYYETIHSWLNHHFKDKKIIIKKHPKDRYLYNWTDLNITFIEGSLPAEILISQLKNQEIIFMFISTAILELLGTDKKYSVLHFKNVENKEYQDMFAYLESKLDIESKYIKRIGK